MYKNVGTLQNQYLVICLLQHKVMHHEKFVVFNQRFKTQRFSMHTDIEEKNSGISSEKLQPDSLRHLMSSNYCKAPFCVFRLSNIHWVFCDRPI